MSSYRAAQKLIEIFAGRCDSSLHIVKLVCIHHRLDDNNGCV